MKSIRLGCSVLILLCVLLYNTANGFASSSKNTNTTTTNSPPPNNVTYVKPPTEQTAVDSQEGPNNTTSDKSPSNLDSITITDANESETTTTSNTDIDPLPTEIDSPNTPTTPNSEEENHNESTTPNNSEEENHNGSTTPNNSEEEEPHHNSEEDEEEDHHPHNGGASESLDERDNINASEEEEKDSEIDSSSIFLNPNSKTRQAFRHIALVMVITALTFLASFYTLASVKTISSEQSDDADTNNTYQLMQGDHGDDVNSRKLPNSWELGLIYPFFQIFASLSLLSATSSLPSLLQYITDSFAWMFFIISKNNNSDSIMSEENKNGIDAMANRFGIEQSEMCSRAIVLFAILIGSMLLLSIICIVIHYINQRSSTAHHQPPVVWTVDNAFEFESRETLPNQEATSRSSTAKTIAIFFLNVSILVWYVSVLPLTTLCLYHLVNFKEEGLVLLASFILGFIIFSLAVFALASVKYFDSILTSSYKQPFKLFFLVFATGDIVIGIALSGVIQTVEVQLILMLLTFSAIGILIFITKPYKCDFEFIVAQVTNACKIILILFLTIVFGLNEDNNASLIWIVIATFVIITSVILARQFYVLYEFIAQECSNNNTKSEAYNETSTTSAEVNVSATPKNSIPLL